MPIFSVVIPLYNKAQSIRQTVTSVLSQTLADFEMIIVDDGSTDGSAEAVACLSDPRIRLVRQENRGVSAARNTGIELATAEYIAFLDADDLWLPSFLEEMATLLRDFPEAGIYGSAYWHQRGSTRYQDDYCLSPRFRGYIDSYFTHAWRHLLYCASAVIVSKAALQQSGVFNPGLRYGEDLDLWFRLAIDHRAAFYNEPLAVYNKDAENRAMQQKQPYETNFIAHTAQYKPAEARHEDFRKFINFFRCIKLPEVFDAPNMTKDMIRSYENLITRDDLPVKYRVFLRAPVDLQRWLWNIRTRFLP